MSDIIKRGIRTTMTGREISQKLFKSKLAGGGCKAEISDVQKVRMVVHRPHVLEIHSL
jgi:hypothetical protein